MLFEQILFFVGAAGAIGGAVAVVLLRNPFFSVLALAAHLVSLALLFLLLSAAFVAAAQVVIYATAVMVLYVFVVAYIGGVDDPISRAGGVLGRLGPFFAAALLAELTIAVVGSGLKALDSRGPDVAAGFGSPAAIGKILLEKFLIPFEVSSILLLVAVVGALVLTRRRRGLAGLEEDELPERAGPAPAGHPEDRAGAEDWDDEGPPPGTAEGEGDPTPDRDTAPPEEQEPADEPEPEREPVTTEPA